MKGRRALAMRTQKQKRSKDFAQLESSQRRRKSGWTAVDEKPEDEHSSKCFSSSSRNDGDGECTGRSANLAKSETSECTDGCGDSDNYDQDLFDLLPDDVLGRCLFSGYVDTIRLIKSLSCVSKRTRRVAKETVKMLDLRKCSHLKPAHIENIVSRFGNVSVLDLNYCTQISGLHLLKLVPLSSTLRTLRVRGSSVTDRDISTYLKAVEKYLSGPSRLRELDLSAITKMGSLRINDAAVTQITYSCPDLEMLHLGWCSKVSDLSVECLGRLRCLESLDLSLCGISAKSCGILSTMKSLKSLDISCIGGSMGDIGIQRLFGVTKQSPSSVATSSILSPDFQNKSKGSGFSNLEALCVQFTKNLSADTLRALVTCAPNLKILDTSHCTWLDKEDGRPFLRALKRNGTIIIDEKGSISFRSLIS